MYISSKLQQLSTTTMWLLSIIIIIIIIYLKGHLCIQYIHRHCSVFGETRGRKLKETVLNEIITITVDIENTINV